jgi:hypothetical protein
MPAHTPIYAIVTFLGLFFYLFFGMPWISSSDSTMTSTPSPTAKVTATATWIGNARTIIVHGTPVAETKALVFAEVVVKQARHRPRIVEVCSKGICSKRWVVSA